MNLKTNKQKTENQGRVVYMQVLALGHYRVD